MGLEEILTVIEEPKNKSNYMNENISLEYFH